jgi:hypothetical protein
VHAFDDMREHRLATEIHECFVDAAHPPGLSAGEDQAQYDRS